MDNDNENIFINKDFKTTTEFLTKKYTYDINDPNFLDVNNKKDVFIDGKDNVEINKCYDLNIYQNIQTRINENYFLDPIEINNIYNFDYNKIFYYLNHDNIRTLDKNVLEIKEKIQSMINIIKDKYNDETKYILNFNPSDYDSILQLYKNVVYYENYRDEKSKEGIAYNAEEKSIVDNLKTLLYNEYKNRLNIYKIIYSLDIKEIAQKDINDEIKPDFDCKANDSGKYKFECLKIDPIKINITKHKSYKIIIGKIEYPYNSFLVYEEKNHNFIPKKDDDDSLINVFIKLYNDEFISKILKINKKKNYDILYFVYSRIKKFYDLFSVYFDLTNSIIKNIKENKYGTYDNQIKQINKLIKDSELNYVKNIDINLFDKYKNIIEEEEKKEKEENFKSIKEIEEEYKIRIESINLYNKIINIYDEFNMENIQQHQNFYFTLFFKDTITKPLDIAYINPSEYHNNFLKHIKDDDFFYKKYHQVYLMSNFNDLKIFNELKEELLYLNFKIDCVNNQIIFLNKNKDDLVVDSKEIFYFYYVGTIGNLVEEKENINKYYVLNETYEKLLNYYKQIYNPSKEYKNEIYDKNFFEYKKNFLSVYDDAIITKNRLEEYEALKKAWDLIVKSRSKYSDSYINYKPLLDNIQNQNKNTDAFINKLKSLYESGHNLLNYYYETLNDENNFNEKLEAKIIDYKNFCITETDKQFSEYIKSEDRDLIKNEYKTNLNEINEINENMKEEFRQTIKTFCYILFDLLMNRIFINQKFTYPDFINKIINIYFGIFNLLFYESDETNINQYKKLLEYCLSYYEIVTNNGRNKLINVNEKFKTLEELEKKSDEIIENLYLSFIFIYVKYLKYKITENSVKVIKIIINAYIYYYSLYKNDVIIDGQTVFINESNKDIYYGYQKLIIEREDTISLLKELFKGLKDERENPESKKTLSEVIKSYNEINQKIVAIKEELLNSNIIKKKEKKEENNINKKNNEDFKKEIKKKYITPFINLIEQMVDDEKIVNDEKIKKLLNDKLSYFQNLKDDNINSQIFKNSLILFNKYKNLRINQRLTNKEVLQYGINETLTNSLIELIKSQQIKNGDYFLVSKNKKVKDAYIYLLNEYRDLGENGFEIKINNMNGFFNLLNGSIDEKDKENQIICKFVIDNQNNTGALKIKINELTNNGFKNNQLLGKYKLLQRQ